MSTLESIQHDVEQLADKIGAPAWRLPTYGGTEDMARPHIEVTSDGLMHWVVVERGEEIQRRSTWIRNELLYWIFQSVTFSMASSWEARHRIADEDFRKQLFTKQFELLNQLDPRWAERCRAELGHLLKDAGL